MNNIIHIYNKIAPEYFKCRENLALYPELQSFMTNIPKHGLILDAGCGNGRDLKIFSENGFKAVGVDGSSGQITIANSRSYPTKISIICSDIRTFTYPQKFDGIWCNAVLPHFSNDDILKILRRFKNLLSSDGLILCTFKAGTGVKQVEESEFNNIKRYTNFHLEDDIKHFAEEVGLTILESHRYNERERFNAYNRNMDFIVTAFSK